MVVSLKIAVAVVLFCVGASSPGISATLLSQTPSPILNTHYSDVDQPQYAYTAISLASASTITNVTWRGLYSDLVLVPPAPTDQFTIGIFQNIGGALGAAVGGPIAAGHVNRVDTGTDAFSRDVFEYSYALSQPLAAGNYFLAIVNNTGGSQGSWAWVGGAVPGGTDLVGFSYGTSSLDFPNSGRYVILDGRTDAVSPVPVPAALPLFATVLAGGGLIAWRRKRKTAKMPTH